NLNNQVFTPALPVGKLSNVIIEFKNIDFYTNIYYTTFSTLSFIATVSLFLSKSNQLTIPEQRV
ncbi:MAG: hypothetical protein ACI4E0_04435, partial [Blautia sp.]